MYAKKSLGQHFLRSERALSTIIESSELNSGDTVLEIGPGEGVLTEKLIENAGKVFAIEKDDELFIKLQNKFMGEEKLELIHGDVLDFDPSKFKSGHYKLVANIPYNITGAILEKFLSSDYQPVKMVLLVQKEVAERIVARDGKESILSISVKAYGNPKVIETVKAGSFVPMPRVDSAIISIENISKDFFNPPSGRFAENRFFEILKAGFSSKRKKLSSNLSLVAPKEKVQEVFQKLNLNENLRAEDLDILGWQKLSEEIARL